ncbi:hypothetical protein [Streptomyces sp. NPDC089919]|uniref:hypothetical protein n=1 Tax=Streptomyces sp. NPDC089919 TaxID=3155188 RepID=UPI0034299DA0
MNASDGPGPGNELDLRSLLQGAVEGLEPSDGALDRLRVAVPARRARKRQVLVGAAAAALLAGVALPAFFRVAQTPDQVSGASAMAGHGEDARSGQDGDTTRPDLTGPGVLRPTAAPGGKDKGGKGHKSGKPDRHGKGHGDSRASGGGDGDDEDGGTRTGGRTHGRTHAPVVAAPGTPACQADQLGVAVQDTGSPDAEGKVYGTFRITNVSQSGCSVAGAGSVTGLTGDQRAVTVLDHTAGDPAAGLPDPGTEVPGLMLTPNAAYEVRFAWVPSAACPDPSPTPQTSASPDGGAGGTDPGTDGGTEGTTDPDPLDGDEPDGDTGGEPPAPESTSLQVVHTAEPGAPTAAASIPNACSGTLYRTGVLPAPEA